MDRAQRRSQRQCVVPIVIDESTGDFRGIGHLHQLWSGPKAEAGDDLVRMMEIALIHARRELKRCESVVKDYVGNMTSRERLRLPLAGTGLVRKPLVSRSLKFPVIERCPPRPTPGRSHQPPSPG